MSLRTPNIWDKGLGISWSIVEGWEDNAFNPGTEKRQGELASLSRKEGTADKERGCGRTARSEPASLSPPRTDGRDERAKRAPCYRADRFGEDGGRGELYATYYYAICIHISIFIHILLLIIYLVVNLTNR